MPLKEWQPKTVIVNEIDDALWARSILPDATIGLRLMPDNEYQTKYTVEQWLAKWQPHFVTLRKHRIHAVTGNEPRGYDPQLDQVINFDAQLAWILADEEIGGMFARFPVGHPSDVLVNLAKLRPLADAIRAYEKHFYMTNEYAINTQPLLEQRWFIGRFQQVFDVVGPMPTIIGEISVNTPDRDDPGKQDSWSGWRSSFDGEIEPFIHALKLMWERIYEPAGVHSMCVFLVGGASDQRWQNLANEQTQWAVFINAMAAYRPAPEVIDEPAIEPEPISIPIEEKPPMSEDNTNTTPLPDPVKVAPEDKSQRKPVIEPLLMLLKSRRAMIAALLTIFISFGLATIPEMRESMNTYIMVIISAWLGVAFNYGVEDVIAQWKTLAAQTETQMDDAAVKLLETIQRTM